MEVNIWKRDVSPVVDRNAVGGAGTGGLMTSCCCFLLAHGKMPEEQEGEDGGWRKLVEESQLEQASRHMCLTVNRRESKRGKLVLEKELKSKLILINT